MPATPIEQAHELRTRWQTKLDSIRNDNSLSNLGKQRAIARDYSAHTAELARLQDQFKGSRTQRKQALEKKYFALPAGASAQDVLSYRDALDRARSIKDEKDAIASMGQANMIGDTILAKALLSHSYAQGWDQAINAWEGKHTAPEGDLQQLWNLTHEEQLGGSIADEFAFASMEPSELLNTTPAQRGALADAAGNGNRDNQLNDPANSYTAAEAAAR